MRKVIAVFILHCASYMATIRANKADILGEQEEVQFQSLRGWESPFHLKAFFRGVTALLPHRPPRPVRLAR